MKGFTDYLNEGKIASKAAELFYKKEVEKLIKTSDNGNIPSWDGYQNGDTVYYTLEQRGHAKDAEKKLKSKTAFLAKKAKEMGATVKISSYDSGDYSGDYGEATIEFKFNDSGVRKAAKEKADKLKPLKINMSQVDDIYDLKRVLRKYDNTKSQSLPRVQVNDIGADTSIYYMCVADSNREAEIEARKYFKPLIVAYEKYFKRIGFGLDIDVTETYSAKDRDAGIITVSFYLYLDE